jgi:CDP-diacylglycerol--glycerol-3-phosphate 3-phosphatidyltransferase
MPERVVARMARTTRADTIRAMDGLYALKPWYATRLRSVRSLLVARSVTPFALTVAGVGCGALGGAALAASAAAPGAGLLVPPLALARLAFANLDGGVARETAACTRIGSVYNEVGDRLADLALLAGGFALAPAWLVLAAMLAATLPSWVALAGAAAGARRGNGGPFGKTERCLLFAVAAVLPAVSSVPARVAAGVGLAVVAAGSAVTAASRLVWLRAALAAPAAAPAAASVTVPAGSAR